MKSIGIDLGHCETTAAYPTKETVNNKWNVLRLEVQRKEYVISTQILLTYDQMRKLKGIKEPRYEDLKNLGKIEIGNDANKAPKNGEHFSYFKVPPKDFNSLCGKSETAKAIGLTHGMVMACFIYAIFENIMTYNTGRVFEGDRKDIELLIGCPTTSAWTSKDAQKKYADLVKRATAVSSVRIVPESRAAMFSSIENSNKAISAIDGAMVFDFGSSTADCTYMLLGRKIIEFSWTLGASSIDTKMTMEALNRAMRSNSISHPIDIGSIEENLDMMRRTKEEYYRGRRTSKPVCTFWDEEGTEFDVLLKLDKDFMEQITEKESIDILCNSITLQNGSWQELCEAFFRAARQEVVSKGLPLKNIVLTGGASQMDFVEELCKKVFGQLGCNIYLEQNPSYTVSNGLGWVSVSDQNEEECIERARVAIHSDPAYDIRVLKNTISNEVFQEIRKIVPVLTKQWADIPGDTATLRMLQGSMEQYLSSAEGRGKIERIYDSRINEWKGKLVQKMGDAINEQAEALFTDKIAQGLFLPTDIWKKMAAENIKKYSLDSENLIKGLNLDSVLSTVGRYMTSFAIVFVLMSLGIVGWLIGVVISAFILSGGEISDEDLDKPRTQKDRKKVASKIESKIGSAKAEIAKCMDAAFEDYEKGIEQMVDQTLGDAFDIVMLRNFSLGYTKQDK